MDFTRSTQQQCTIGSRRHCRKSKIYDILPPNSRFFVPTTTGAAPVGLLPRRAAGQGSLVALSAQGRGLVWFTPGDLRLHDHPALKNVPAAWPHFLGYNKTLPLDGCDIVMRIEGDPFLAFGEFGGGRAGAFASDCAPHWGPREFLDWEGFTPLWDNLVRWLTRAE